MSQKYLLPCSCGKEVSIETSQAGGNVLCDCGLSLRIPSLLKIKQLPPEGGVQIQSPSAPDVPAEPTVKKSTSRRVNFNVFLIGLYLTFAAVAYCTYTVLFTFPKPQDVLDKQVYYHYAGRFTLQDSTPIPIDERYFFEITDEIIDHLNPVDARSYWNLVKDGPAMSMNFRENYETFKDRYILRCVGTGLLVVLALCILISSFFLGRTKTVGTRQGTVWK
ncbi:MAG: hypothetical protein FWC43_14665 [Planctomycetaceae bacterium]|nr:hypothetical protein [Planctomycetaceae bacterium]